jgi:hypothetical protein
LPALLKEMAKAKRRFGLPDDAGVVSRYQAGGMVCGCTAGSLPAALGGGGQPAKRSRQSDSAPTS